MQTRYVHGEPSREVAHHVLSANVNDVQEGLACAETQKQSWHHGREYLCRLRLDRLQEPFISPSTTLLLATSTIHAVPHLEHHVVSAELDGVKPRRVRQPQVRLWLDRIEVEGGASLDEKGHVRLIQAARRQQNLERQDELEA